MTGRWARARAVADGKVQAAYRRYIDHLMDCLACDSPDGCRRGDVLRHDWRVERDTASSR